MNKGCYILLLALLSSCYIGEELPPDQQVWEYAYPTSVGLSDESLYATDQALKDESYGLINGMIIIKDDRLVFENYYNFNKRNEPVPVGRVTFSLLILTLDLFIEDGYIALNEPISSYLPTYKPLFDNDTLKQEITVKHIITNRSGLVWNETQPAANDLFMITNSDDWVRYILNKPMEAPPGLRSVINSGMGLVLAKILQNQLGDIALEDYLMEHFFSKLNIATVQWEKSPGGVLNGANGLSISTLDLTKIGYLMLNEGRWTDKQRVISRDWVLDITTVQSEEDANYSLGYSWWLFSDNFSSQWLGLSSNSSYFAAGERGQNLYVIPSENMVICITADNYNMNFFNYSLSLFVKSLESLQPALAN